MAAIENEMVLRSSGNNSIVLTTHKIKQQYGKNFTIIPLEKVSTVKVYYKEHFIYMIVGILCLISALIYFFAEHDGAGSFIAVILGVVFIAIFLVSRRHVVSVIADNSQSIVFNVKGMSHEKVVDFISALESAKYDYLKRMLSPNLV